MTGQVSRTRWPLTVRNVWRRAGSCLPRPDTPNRCRLCTVRRRPYGSLRNRAASTNGKLVVGDAPMGGEEECTSRLDHEGAHLSAPRDQVWRALTDPAELVRWFPTDGRGVTFGRGRRAVLGKDSSDEGVIDEAEPGNDWSSGGGARAPTARTRGSRSRSGCPRGRWHRLVLVEDGFSAFAEDERDDMVAGNTAGWADEELAEPSWNACGASRRLQTMASAVDAHDDGRARPGRAGLRRSRRPHEAAIVRELLDRRPPHRDGARISGRHLASGGLEAPRRTLARGPRIGRAKGPRAPVLAAHRAVRGGGSVDARDRRDVGPATRGVPPAGRRNWQRHGERHPGTGLAPGPVLTCG